MASSRKSFLAKPSHIFPATSDEETHNYNPPKSSEGGGGGCVFEFDEADLWNFSNNNNNAEAKNKALLSSGSRSALKRVSKKKVDFGGRGSSSRSTTMAPASLPVNIPDWSKILKEDYKEHRNWEGDDVVVDCDDEGQDGGGIRVPPHEYLARTRGASLSVHEGIGRTLKGRDLRSVRNAIWKKVGFED